MINNGKVQFYLDPERSNEQKNEFLAKFKYYAANTALRFYQGQQVFSQDKVFNCAEILEGYTKKLCEIRSWSDYYSETISNLENTKVR